LRFQNRDLAINVLGWESNCVIVHRMSRKEAKVLQIKLMLNWLGEIQHYCPNYFPVPLQLFYKILDQLFWVGIADMHRLSFKHVTNAH